MGIAEDNREVVTIAFEDWMAGCGNVSRIFDPVVAWEIVGCPAAAGPFTSAQEFTDNL